MVSSVAPTRSSTFYAFSSPKSETITLTELSITRVIKELQISKNVTNPSCVKPNSQLEDVLHYSDRCRLNPSAFLGNWKEACFSYPTPIHISFSLNDVYWNGFYCF